VQFLINLETYNNMIKSLKINEVCTVFGAKYKCFCRTDSGSYARIDLKIEYTEFFLHAFNACFTTCCSSGVKAYTPEFSDSVSSYGHSRMTSAGSSDGYNTGYVVDDMRDEPGFTDRPYYFNCDEDSEM